MPLMKRTVRDDSGAMLWLKNAAVRAVATARSSFVEGAPALRSTARMRPARSTTAIVTGSLIAFAAARAMVSTSAIDSEPKAPAPSSHVAGVAGGVAQPAGSSAVMMGIGDEAEGGRTARGRGAASAVIPAKRGATVRNLRIGLFCGAAAALGRRFSREPGGRSGRRSTQI